MKTIEEKIAIMQAFAEGKKIECKQESNNIWVTVDKPVWNWNCCDYRVKQILKLRPYNNAEEFLKAQKEHGMYLISKNDQDRARIPLIVKNDELFMPWCIDSTHLTGYTFRDILNHWVHQDGTPCGVIEEE